MPLSTNSQIFPPCLPPEVNDLSEPTSIDLARKIQQHVLETPLGDRAIATAYVRQGSSTTPILSIHGFDSSSLEFRRLFPLLAAERETWTIDLLGFGFTERSPGLTFSTEAIKTHLYCFWQALVQRPVILVGASMGGATAIDFTLTYPEAVKRLVLLDSAGLANPPMSSKFMFPPLDYLATEFLRNARVRENICRAAYYDKQWVSADALLCGSLHLGSPGWRQAMASFTKSGGYGSFARRLCEIEQPTLILWGENDKILGTKAARQFEEQIPNNTLVWIRECGHFPHLEQAQIAADRILAFSRGDRSAN